MPLKSSRSDRDIQFIHSAPKMRPTALKQAKNQGLASIPQNKKIKKIKNCGIWQRSDVFGYRGGRVRKRGRKIAPFTGTRGGFNTSVFMPYVTKPPRSPRGTAAGGAAAGLLLRPYGGGGCCCGAAATGTGEAKRGGRAAPRERVTATGNGGRVRTSPKSPIISINN